MMQRGFWLAAAAGVAIGATAVPAAAQLPDYPLAPLRPSGDLVAPFFDGYYTNEDGSHVYSFGFLNRNLEEEAYIPIGPDNFIEPAEFDGRQPEWFPVMSGGGFVGKRDRGSFAVEVPAGFTEDVVWTLTYNGQTWSVPGRATSPAYELSYTPAAAGSLAPSVRFGEDGEVSTTRLGAWDEPKTVQVGEGLPLSLWVADRGERENDERAAVTVNWVRHQGPGPIEFDTPRERLDEEGFAEATTVATFSVPGEYIVRARVDNHAGASDSRPDNQCCWTNAYVPVTVTP